MWVIFEKTACGPSFSHTAGDRVDLTEAEIHRFGDAVTIDADQHPLEPRKPEWVIDSAWTATATPRFDFSLMREPSR